MKPVALTKAQQWENAFLGLCTVYWMAGSLVWYVRLCLAQYEKAQRRGQAYWPKLPVCISLFGNHPHTGYELLAGYGVKGFLCFDRWVIHWDRVGKQVSFFVAASQWEQADGILSNYAGNDYAIVTNAGGKRGYNYGKPFNQRGRNL